MAVSHLGAAAEPVSDHARREPVPALRPFVASYAGYRQAGVPAAVHRGLPSPVITVILTLDEPLQLATGPGPASGVSRHDTLIGGLHTEPALIVHQGSQSGIQVSLEPLGARWLLGVPAGELASLDVPADAVWGPAVETLRARLLELGSWAERFDVLDHYLLDRIATVSPDAQGAPRVAPEVAHAWRRLRRAGGAIAVSELASEVGWSPRHLSGRFRFEIGLPVKVSARVVRFDRARRMLAAGSALATVAADCGYADQAHLTRDFGDLAGCTPTAWLAEEFRNIQDGLIGPEQSVRHD